MFPWDDCIACYPGDKDCRTDLINPGNVKSKRMTIYLLEEIQQVLDLFTSPRLEQLIKLRYLKPELKLKYLKVCFGNTLCALKILDWIQKLYLKLPSPN